MSQTESHLQRILHSGQPITNALQRVDDTTVFTITIRILGSEIKMVIESYKEYSTWRSHWGNVKL